MLRGNKARRAQSRVLCPRPSMAIAWAAVWAVHARQRTHPALPHCLRWPLLTGDPLSLAFFAGGEFLLAGGSDK